MTKNLPADAQRPPHFLPPRPAVFRTPSRQASIATLGRGLHSVKPEQGDVSNAGFEDAPPTKRRKVDSPVPLDGREKMENTEPSRNPHTVPMESATGAAGEFADPSQFDFPNKYVPTGSAPPPPLPTRPWKHRPAVKESSQDIRYKPRVRQNGRVPTTPCKLVTPLDAPNVLGKAVADYYPWLGNHTEDVLNEQTVKNGQSDKSPQTWNESNTARPTLYNNCKHRFGLQTLSALFTSVMQQRALNQKPAVELPFKPPPRAMLTEAKRKAWLNDLANATVPLRKLSKSIPQGIRGQPLLDQCLANSVPISRAIWFAKCVGANEIRTLKRNKTTPALAANHEAKWSKDWTVNIQQFTEAVMSDCGTPEWRSKINYCLTLITRLYREDLLDKDSFLDWILDSATTSTLDRFPFWLMFLHTHHKDLTLSRKRGRHLAELILEKLALTQNGDVQDFKPLTERLQKFTKALVISRPVCFLMPQQWQKYKSVLSGCLDFETMSNQRLFEHLCRVNERVAGPTSQPDSPPLSPRQRVIQLLDMAQCPYNVKQLAKDCSGTCVDGDLLITTTIEWSCTRFRSRKDRLYLAIRLLRSWHRNGYDLNGTLLVLLVPDHKSRMLEPQSLHHLVAELVRSGDFSTSQYLQWLIARGAPRDCFGDAHVTFTSSYRGSTKETMLPRCMDQNQLLTELPLMQLPEHVKSLRSTLLVRAGFGPEAEAAAIDHCKRFLAKNLGEICVQFQDIEGDHDYSVPDFSQLSWTIKADIGQWLREVIRSCFKASTGGLSSKAVSGPAVLSLAHFVLIRGVYEDMNDLAMLADVLCHTSRSHDESVLAAIVDTIDAHVAALSAIGALTDLHRRLSERYLALKAAKVFLPKLAISLLDLELRQFGLPSTIQGLRDDMIRGDKGNLAAAFSPFSDGMAESLQQAGSTFVEDFEAVLRAEPNMTEKTMNPLFDLIMGRLLKSQFEDETEPSRNDLCLLLARLRIFKPSHFEQLMSSWIRPVLASPNKSVQSLILALVDVNCLSMKTIHDSIKTLDKDETISTLKVCRQTISQLFKENTPPSHVALNSVTYRFQKEWSRFLLSNPVDALNTLLLISGGNSGLDVGSAKLAWTSTLVAEIALHHGEEPSDENSEALLFLDGALHDLFWGSQNDPTTKIRDLVETCDDFSLPFCRLYLRVLASPGANQQNVKERTVEALFSSAVSEMSFSLYSVHPISNWLPIVTSIDRDIAYQVRERAEQGFFDAFLPFAQTKLANSPLANLSDDVVSRATKYLDIVSNTAYTISGTVNPSICSQLKDKLAMVWRGLNTQLPAPATPVPGLSLSVPQMSSSSPDIVLLREYLPLLLRLTCMHRRTLSNQAVTIPAKQALQDQICVLLASIALHPLLSDQHELVSHVLDVLATVIDGISEEARARCAHCLKNKMKDPRLTFLFGNMSSVGNATGSGMPLQLVKEGKGVVGEWHVKQWELLDGGLNLGLFQGRVGIAKKTHF